LVTAIAAACSSTRIRATTSGWHRRLIARRDHEQHRIGAQSGTHLADKVRVAGVRRLITTSPLAMEAAASACVGAGSPRTAEPAYAP
jgi:hypothetical protein